MRRSCSAVVMALVTVALSGAFVPAASHAAGWLPPQPISLAGGVAWPQVAMDAAGDAVVVWQRDDGANKRVQASLRPAGGAFSAPTDLSLAGRDATTPKVAMNANGDAIAVWLRSDGQNARVQVAFCPAGGTFGPAVDVSEAGRDAFVPSASLDAAGNAVMVWVRSDGTSNRAQAAVRARAGTVSTPVDLSAAGQVASHPQIGVDAAGNATAVWEASGRVKGAVRPAGGTFAAVDVAPDAITVTPALAVAPDGAAVLGWNRIVGTNQVQVQAALRAPGGGFGAPVDLSAISSAAGPVSVAINAKGDVAVGWETFPGGFASILPQASARLAGGTFSAPVDLTDDYGAATKVSITADGTAIAGWYGFNEEEDVLPEVAMKPPGEPFAGPVALDSSGADPVLAAAGTGDAIAAFVGANGVTAAGFDASPPQLRSVLVPATAALGVPVDMSASVFDVWGAQVRFDFGDGATQDGTAVSHAFSTPGNRTVNVIATDGADHSVSETRSITIPAATVDDPPAQDQTTTVTPQATATPAAATPAAPPTIAQIKSSIAAVLAPAGAGAKLGALSKSKAYKVTLKAPTAGMAKIAWYFTPPRKKGRPKPKPVLVASGQRSFASGETAAIGLKFTAKGLALLKGAKRLKLTAEGTFTAPGQSAVKTSRVFTLRR